MRRFLSGFFIPISRFESHTIGMRRKLLGLSLTVNEIHMMTIAFVLLLSVCSISTAHSQLALEPEADLDSPEAVLRLLIRANAEKDMDTLKNYMAQDPDAIGYTIGGRKYIGWDAFERAMKDEFESVDSLDIQITDLKVWQRDDIAWFAMELDYGRDVTTENGQTHTVIPLRDTGVLERREGKWVLVAWHESLQKPFQTATLQPKIETTVSSNLSTSTLNSLSVDLSGDWEIHEDDKSYQATFDTTGNGPYTWQDGRIVTSKISDHLWSGYWTQKGNDREGEFEVLLSEDYQSAEGVWWYTRVGEHENIPPREWGGKYIFKRLSPPPHPTSGPQ